MKFCSLIFLITSNPQGVNSDLHCTKTEPWGRNLKIINVNISGVYEVICMKLCNLIPLGVKSHLKGRRALLIAPKRGVWAKKSKISNANISGVYEAICM